jgi:alpha-L-arabinofuranosidase
MHISFLRTTAALLFVALARGTPAQDTAIHIDARQPRRAVSRYLTGACIEDVNHEIYGGIYSQMIFGETFQEEPLQSPAKGWIAWGGDWKAADAQFLAPAGDGPKLISSVISPFADGEAGVDVYLPAPTDAQPPNVRNAGLILRVAHPGVGPDTFDGYEVSLDAGRKLLCLGRHQHNYKLLKEEPCDLPLDHWIALSVKLSGATIEISIDGKSALRFDDPHPLPAGGIGLRQWHRTARYRNMWANEQGRRRDLPFEPAAAASSAISAMWRPVITGSAVLEASLEKNHPFTGTQSQRLTFAGGTGEVGIDNRGLNRGGLSFIEAKPYEGCVWLRAEKPTDLFASIESKDGATVLAQTKLSVTGDQWQRYLFNLTPTATETAGQFSLRLKSTGSVVIGYASLQPGEWGRFKGLPVRRDIVEALQNHGVTVLRYGGSMVNEPEYRWKNMVGPRDQRPPYRGHWYPHSTNGWAIPEFLDLCEAAGFLAIPDFSADESPQDMVDFIEYANGTADTPWGKRRAAAGHPAPYNLYHLELGNEEKVDQVYYQKFEKLATAIWAKDPKVVLVIGDFQYERTIVDPLRIEGADSGIKSLAAHQQILELAKAKGGEVWFDVHLWTEGPNASASVKSFKSYVDAIDHLAHGARHQVVVFELNSNNHDLRRALANADTLGAIMRDGRVPVALAANCLQPDGQNDNGWDQGLLFLNPVKTWPQPPAYVTQMIARHLQSRLVNTSTEGADETLTVTATQSEDGKDLCLQVVNLSNMPKPAQLRFDGYMPTRDTATVIELAGNLTDQNTATEPSRISPKETQWHHIIRDGHATYAFPPHSFTIIHLN